MTQEFEIIFLFFLSVIIYLYYKIKKKNISEYIVTWFTLGMVFTFLGSILIYLFNNEKVLLDALFLKTFRLSGRLILVGYSFLLTSFLFLIDTLIRKRREKRNQP